MKNTALFFVLVIAGSRCKSGEIKTVDPFRAIQPATVPDNRPALGNDTLNDLYKIGKKYGYGYCYIQKNRKFKFTSSYEPDTETKKWGLSPIDKSDKGTIEKIYMDIPDPSQLDPSVVYEVNQHLHGQTLIRYSYLSPEDRILSYEITGLVEQEQTVFFHPPRLGYFKILELNPFPYMLTATQKTDCWRWQLNAVSGYVFGDAKWRKWEGLIDIDETYKNAGRRKVYCKAVLRSVWCTKIQAGAVSDLGKTSLVAYFNEQLGFVRLEYQNIDQSKLILELIELPT